MALASLEVAVVAGGSQRSRSSSKQWIRTRLDSRADLGTELGSVLPELLVGLVVLVAVMKEGGGDGS